MKNKKLVRILEAFVIFPVMTMSVQYGDIPKSSPTEMTAPQFVSSLKQNTGLNSLFALNQATEGTPEDKEAKVLQATRAAKADAIDAFFAKRDAPLEGLGMTFITESEKNDLDWRLLPALSIIESNGGKQACKGATFSFMGYGSCKINFKSRESGIERVARSIGGNDPKTDRFYQKGMSLDKLLKTYNSVIPTYSQKVIKVMEMIGPEEITLDAETKTEA